MHLESRLHEVYLALLDVEDLVDLGHQISEGLHLKGLSAFWFGIVCHLHAHHLLFYSEVVNGWEESGLGLMEMDGERVAFAGETEQCDIIIYL